MKRARAILVLTIFSMSCILQSASAQQAPPPGDFTGTPWVTGYYPSWSANGMRPKEINYKGLTHIVHFCVDPSRTEPYVNILVNSPEGQATKKSFELGEGHIWGVETQAELIANAHLNGTKVLLSVGGVYGTGASDMAYVASDETRAATFARAASDYARSKGYDGIEIDWEQYLSQTGMTSLIDKFRARLDEWSPPGILALAAMRNVSSTYVPSVINSKVDQFNLMMYDYYWIPGYFGHNCTAYNAPLHKPDPKYGDLSYTLAYDSEGPVQWAAAGMNKARLGVGVPFYGYIYRGKTAPNQTNPGTPSYVSNQQHIQQLINAGGTQNRDDYAKVPWVGGRATQSNSYVTVGQDYYLTYDDPASLSEKVSWSRSVGVGGIMIYDLFSGWVSSPASGAPRDPLLRATVDAVAGMTTFDVTTQLAPTVTIQQPTTSESYSTSTAAVQLSGTASDNTGIASVRYYNIANGATGTASGTGSWSATVPLAAGVNWIIVNARDAHGNTHADEIKVTTSVTSLDVTVPTVSISTPTASATHLASASPFLLGGNASDNNAVVSVTVSNAANGASATASGTSNWSASIALAAGSNLITVTARDAAGNAGTDTITVTYSPSDAVAPSVAITGPTSSSTYSTTSSSITLSGTSSDNVGVVSVTSTRGSVSGTTSWSNVVSLASGSNTITLTARDAAGNIGTDTITVTYSPVIAPPPAVVLEPLPLNFANTPVGTEKSTGVVVNPTGATSASMTLSAHDIDSLAEVAMFVNGTAVALPSSIVANGAVKTIGFSINPSLLINGTNVVKFRFASNLNGTTRGFRIDAVRIIVVVPVVAPLSTTDVWIYRDALNTSAADWSWSSTRDYANTTPVYAGTRSIKVVTSPAWGALSLHSNVRFTNPALYTGVEFYVHGGSTVETLYVSLGDGTGFTNLSAGTTTVGAWKRIFVPMSTLNPNNLAFDRISIQSSVAGDFYVDEFRLVGVK